MSAGQPSAPQAVVCDYGGVLTNPLAETLNAYCDRFGLGLEEVGAALARVGERLGETPMARLEVGALTEPDFMAMMRAELVAAGTSPPAGMDFRESWFAGRTANQPFVEYLRGLRRRGVRLGLLTNNVAEWERLWRATIPVDELFELVVNSAEERIRKPNPEIYRRTLERLGLPGPACVFVDDLEENCAVAEEVGMVAVRFADAAQAAHAIDALLNPGADGARAPDPDTDRRHP